MNKEFLYMQKLAGIITEGEYKEKVKVNEDLSGHFSPVAKELETYLKSKGFENIKTSKGSSDAKKEIEGSESENKFHGSFAIQNNPDLKGKNKTAFITTEPVFHEDVKSFMVFLPHDREDLKGEIETKFSANPASGGAGVYYSFFIPAEKQSVKESLKTSLKTILKEILAEAENTNLKDFALKKIKPYLEGKGYEVGLFNSVPDIPKDKMKENKKLAALVLDRTGNMLDVILSNDSPEPGNAVKILGKGGDGDLVKTLNLKPVTEVEKGEIYVNSKGFSNYGSNLGIQINVKN